MISVCIPVFNADVRSVVSALAEEAAQLPFPVEVLLFDDGSSEEFRQLNRQLTGERNLSAGKANADTANDVSPGDTSGRLPILYREMPSNIGRAAIRNEMGRAASYPWLLFLDADSGILSGKFILTYAEAANLPQSVTEAISPQTVPVSDTGDGHHPSVKERSSPSGNSRSILCGGTLYLPDPPEETSRLLRWTYGRKREQLSAEKRRESGKFAITANNFMIRRDLFLRVPFRNSIREYGHEDTVLGYDLVRAGESITHIDNPVLHLGLEPSSEYLEKTKKAVANLLFISENLIRDPLFDRESGLLRLRLQLKRLRLLPFARLLFRLTEPALTANLTGLHPKVSCFDLFRLLCLCSL